MKKIRDKIDFFWKAEVANDYTGIITEPRKFKDDCITYHHYEKGKKLFTELSQDDFRYSNSIIT
jgi:hypothetical protein